MNTTDVVRVLLSERTKLLGFIQCILGRRDGVEDVFQDACLLATAKADTIDDEVHLRAWLRRACRHLCRATLRKERQSGFPLGDHVLDLLEEQWSRQVSDHSSDVFDALMLCVGELASKSQELVRQRYVIGLSVQEIAERLRRTPSSLYVSFSRIHATLADCVWRRMNRLKASNG